MLSQIISNYKKPKKALVNENGTTLYMYLYFKLI